MRSALSTNPTPNPSPIPVPIPVPTPDSESGSESVPDSDSDSVSDSDSELSTVNCPRGEVLFFTDADVVAPRDWISRLCRELELRGAAAVGGGVFRYLRLMGTRPRYVGALPTCNLAVKRSVLDAVGPFDESFKRPASEDFDLCFRMNDLGHRIWFAPECAVHHRHPSSLAPILRRGFVQGREGARLARKRWGTGNNWMPGRPLHWLENRAVFSHWLLRHLPRIPRHYRWIVAGFDLAFAIGWLSHKEEKKQRP
jgi:GT2 family glycosyltransferase